LLDDLLDMVEDKETIRETPTLNGWYSIMRGHEMASKSNWAKAHELVELGERLINLTDRSNLSKYVWQNVTELEDYVS